MGRVGGEVYRCTLQHGDRGIRSPQLERRRAGYLTNLTAMLKVSPRSLLWDKYHARRSARATPLEALWRCVRIRPANSSSSLEGL